LKTYLKNPMKGMQQMNNMYGMPHMMDMQSMYKMMQSMYQMMGMQGMCPMMNMQGMYPIMNMQGMYPMMNMQGMYPMMNMQGMYPMMDMQGMYPMMNMQGMYPMMDMQGMYPMMDMQDDERQFSIPMLAKLEQISPNKIQISYDRDVDVMLGMKPTNYWIQDTMNVIPEGIGTLGRNDTVNAGNSLTRSMAKIEAMNGSAKTFIITFNGVIPKGAEYRLIICYVTVKGAPPYSGDNGMATFIGK